MSQSSNTRFFQLLRTEGFEAAYRFAVNPTVHSSFLEKGIRKKSTRLHCNVLMLVLMTPTSNLYEQRMKEHLVLYLLSIGVSVMRAGVDENGMDCWRYTNDLSLNTYSFLFLYMLREQKPNDGEETTVEAAKILTCSFKNGIF
jgi:hypothetical protein